MKIRELEKKDVEFLTQARERGFHDGWNGEMIDSAWKTERFFGFIAEKNESIGFITYSIGLDFADIESVFVLDSERGKGVGKALLNSVLADIKSRNINKVLLEVRESNINAQRLYFGAGFNKISVRKNYYSDGENALVLVKELK